MESIKISPELYDTVLENAHIEEVHFSADNKHYFNIHELLDIRSKRGTGKYYGYLKVEQKSVGVDASNRPIFKMVQVANPEALIVKTLTRSEILEMETTPLDEIFGTKAVMANKRKAAKVSKAAA